MLYILDNKNRIHRKNCTMASVSVKTFQSIDLAVKAPRTTVCGCCRTEYYQNLAQRNAQIVEKMPTAPYWKSVESEVIHRGDCLRLLHSRQIQAVGKNSIQNGVRMCKVCHSLRNQVALEEQPGDDHALAILRQVRKDAANHKLWDCRSTAQKSVLCNSKWAYIADPKRKTVHKRLSYCVYHVEQPRGYMTLAGAIRDGYTVCEKCSPKEDGDLEWWYPWIDHPVMLEDLAVLCRYAGFRYKLVAGKIHIIQTSCGVWYLHTDKKPYELEHRQRQGASAGHRHHQKTRFFTEWQAFLYIKNHDAAAYKRNRKGD